MPGAPPRSAWPAPLWWGAAALAILVAAILRLPTVTAGYPYLAYVDEGHLLRPTRALLGSGHWDAAQNVYPELPGVAIAGAARLAAALGAFGDQAAALRQPAPPTPYEILEPPRLLLVARVLALLSSLAMVAVTGLYARTLAGDVAGVAAMAAAALLPALVIRGAIVAVDAYATLFVVLALALVASATGAERTPSPFDGRVALAGACCGLAAVSKYPAGLVGLAVVLVILLASWPWRQRARAAALAAASGLVAALLAMPAIWQQTRAVLAVMRWQGQMYRTLRIGSYWQQAIGRAEWDLPFTGPEMGAVFLALALAGLAVALAERRWRAPAAAWSLLAIALVAVYARYEFQAFRNLLPLMPIACVAFGLLVTWVGQRLRRPLAAMSLGVIGLLLLFGAGDVRYARERRGLVDSRVQAVDWVAAHPRRGPVVALQATWLSTRELARAGAVALPWPAARPLLQRRGAAVLLVPLVTGALPDAERPWLLARYEVRAVFGTQGVPDDRIYRGNDTRIFVLTPRRARDR